MNAARRCPPRAPAPGWLSLLIVLLVSAACAPTLPRGNRAPPPPLESPENALARAEAQLAQGETLAAEESLAYVDTATLDNDERLRLQLLRAELSLASAQPLQALRDLPPAEATADRALAARIASARAKVFRALGDPSEAAAALIDREALLDDPRQRRENARQIWELLVDAPSGTLDDSELAQGSPLERGWLALARIARGETPGARDRLLRNWRARFPDHPGKTEWVVEAQTQGRHAGWARPERRGGIAVLLPLYGDLASLAAAVREGITAAWEQLPQPRPTLRFYDSGTLPEQVGPAFDQAVAEGAALVVGPVRRSHAEALAARGAPPVPVLLLNYLDPQRIAPFNILQYGLAPEDEAQAALLRSIAEGAPNFVALVQRAEWAPRLLRELRDTAETYGGRLLASRFLEPDVPIDDPVRALLGIDEARARHDALTRIIGGAPEFRAKPRGDIDAILVVARQREAAQVVPHLNFHGAEGLPIYLTALAWDGGTPVPREIRSVRLCDMPWMLDGPDARWSQQRAILRERRGDVVEQLPRLVALGHDALELAQALRQGATTGWRIEGATGTLEITPSARVERRLDCALLTAEGARPLSPVATPAPAGTAHRFGDAAAGWDAAPVASPSP